MVSLAWRFPYERIEHAQVLPDEFLCIVSELKVDLQALPQSRIWMIADMGPAGEYLYGHIAAERVGVIEEGINRGSVVLCSDRTLSFRLLPHDRSYFQKWKLGQSSGITGISPIEEPVYRRCLEIIQSNDVRSFSPPSAGKLAAIHTPDSLAPRAFARESFWNALSRFALGDLERWEPDKDLTPFAVLAAQKCRQAGLASEAFDEIKRLDGKLKSVLTGTGESQQSTVTSIGSGVLGVDTFLTPVDPSAIMARHFIEAEIPNASKDRLAKTQEAETKHQAILRDIASFLVGKGLRPLQSRSIDLAHGLSTGLFIAEVKSANLANFVDQAEQGAIQLLRYEMAIEEDGVEVKRKALIIEAAGSNQMVEYIRKLAAKVCFTLMLYDASAPWPGRVAGLLELLADREAS